MEQVFPLKPSFTFYPYSLTNSAKELINELRLQFQSTSLRTPLIHRLMKIPGTNSSSNNRRTIKSSLLNRTPILSSQFTVRLKQPASNETAKSHFMLWIFWKKKEKEENKNPMEPRQEVFYVTLDGVGKLLPSQRCLRQRFISSVSGSSKEDNPFLRFTETTSVSRAIVSAYRVNDSG